MTRRRHQSFFARYKAAIIWGVILIIAGIICIMFAYNLGVSDDYEIKNYTAETGIHTLKLDVGAGEVKTEFYDGDKIYVEYPESGRYKTEITESHNELTIKSDYKWYAHFGITFEFLFKTPTTTIKIPNGTTPDIDFELNAGNLDLGAGTYAKVDIKVNAGNFNAGDIECDSLFCKINAGSINLKKIETENIECKVNAGKIDAEDAVCSEFKCTVNAGNVNVAKLDSHDSEIKVNAGKIDVGFTEAESEYTIIVDKSVGTCNVSNRIAETGKKIAINLSAGEVKCYFNKGN